MVSRRDRMQRGGNLLRVRDGRQACGHSLQPQGSDRSKLLVKCDIGCSPSQGCRPRWMTVLGESYRPRRSAKWSKRAGVKTVGRIRRSIGRRLTSCTTNRGYRAAVCDKKVAANFAFRAQRVDGRRLKVVEHCD
jgi:hypothetical protein